MRSRFSRDHYAIAALMLGGFITHWPWFQLAQIFTSGDWWYITQERYRDFAHFSPIWVTDNFGSTSATPHFYLIRFLEGLLTYFGSNFALNEKLFYMLPIALVAPVGAFLLARRYVGTLAAMVGSIIYTFNTAFLFNQVGPLTIEMAYALAPLCLYFLHRALHDEAKPRPAVLGALTLSVIMLYELRMALIIVALGLGLALYQIAISKQKLLYAKSIIWPALIFGALVVTTQLFWVLPYVISAKAVTFSNVLSRGLFVSFSDITNAITLSHPFWTGARPATFIVQLIPWWSWLVPLLAFGYLLFLGRSPEAREKGRQAHYWALVALLGIFLVKQVNPPFTDVYAWLFGHVPGFGAFRESSKFYLIVALAYAILIPSTLQQAFDAMKTKGQTWRLSPAWPRLAALALAIVASGIFLVNAVPLVNGQFRTLFVARTMPKDYATLNAFLSKQDDFFRILWVPAESRWSLQTNQHPKLTLSALEESAWMPKPSSNNQATGTSRDQFDRLVSVDSTDTLLDKATVKYLVVPLRDTQNEDDFFRYYGNDRQHYIDRLDQAPYLKRINIGTSDIAIYENQNYQPYVAAFGAVQSLKQSSAALDLQQFIEGALHQPLNFTVAGEQSGRPAFPREDLEDEFSQLDQSQLQDNALTKSLTAGPNTTLYYRQNNDIYSYALLGNVLTIYAQKPAGVSLNGHAITPSDGTKRLIASKPLSPRAQYYIQVDGQLAHIQPMAGEHNLGPVARELKIFQSTGDNLVSNPSFETGLWQASPQDCNDYSHNPDVAMDRVKSAGEAGDYALQLETSTDIACTSTALPIEPATSGYYLMSLNYRLTGTEDAGYDIRFGESAPPIQRQFKAFDQNWHKQTALIKAPAPISESNPQASLTLRGYPNYLLNGHAVTQYDNVQFLPLEAVLDLGEVVAPQIGRLPIPTGAATLSQPMAKPVNLISNPSFESGLWRDKVGDCNAYDNQADLGMGLSKLSRSDGRQSLELRARLHTACTSHEPIKVMENQNYLLSFDYQSPNSTKAQYYVVFNDPAGTSHQQSIPITDAGWHSYATQIKAPPGATQLTVVVYAESTNGRQTVVNRYDKFNLVQIPDLAGQYYLITGQTSPLSVPQGLSFVNESPTKKQITIPSASAPFHLAMSEAYNPLWQLKLNGVPVPGAAHYKLNDFENGWYIDINALCKQKQLCKQNSDGTYRLVLVAQFTPQHWLHVGEVISGLALAAAIVFLLRPGRPRPVPPARQSSPVPPPDPPKDPRRSRKRVVRL